MSRYLTFENGWKLKEEAAPYEETLPSQNLSSGTPVTLPNSGTFTAGEAEVRVNKVPQTYLVDYIYEGSSPYTQISFTYDITTDDRVIIRINRELN